MIITERNGMTTPFGVHGKLHVEGAKLMDEQHRCLLYGGNGASFRCVGGSRFS